MAQLASSQQPKSEWKLSQRATLAWWTVRPHPPDRDALRRRTQLPSQIATASAQKLHLVPATGSSRRLARCAAEIRHSPPSHNTNTAKADRKIAARPSSTALPFRCEPANATSDTGAALPTPGIRARFAHRLP